MNAIMVAMLQLRNTQNKKSPHSDACGLYVMQVQG